MHLSSWPSRVVVVLAAAALAACGSASFQTVQLVNRTDRVIENIFIFPTGSAKQGASRGSLAPNATLAVKVQSGNIDVLAISAKVRVNDTQSETRTASQTLEVKAPVQLVFHDSNQTPPGLGTPGTIGVQFRVTAEPEPVKPAAP